MVRVAKDWPWSSYRATAILSNAHECLTIDWILSGFAYSREETCKQYRAFVKQGKNQPSPCEDLKNQVYLGSDLDRHS